MSYLFGYFGIGGGTLLCIFITSQLEKKGDAQFEQDILMAINPRRRKRWYRILHDVVLPTLIGILVIPLWPVLAYIKVKQITASKLAASKEAAPVFVVAHADLLTQVSREEIELLEAVTDPLGAVQSQPFGHLHGAWLTFIETLQPDDHLWSFHALWHEFGARHTRQGYVVVRGGNIGAHFLTMIEQPERD